MAAIHGVNVFTYGSLIFGQVMGAVTGQSYASREAELNGYGRRQVLDASYPGIVVSPGSSVRGRVYLDLTPPSIRLLDRFEGSFYERISVNVQIVDTNEHLEAQTYLFRDKFQHLLADHDWDRDHFERHHLDAFLKSYQGFTWIDRPPGEE